MQKRNRPKLDEEIFQTYQRTIWQHFSPAQRLHHSWILRKQLKNIRKIHDAKLFPHT